MSATDNFFTRKTCQRCGGSLSGGRIMSMLNPDVLCMGCKDKERLDPDYKKAVEVDHEQIRCGNYNFRGIIGE